MKILILLWRPGRGFPYTHYDETPQSTLGSHKLRTDPIMPKVPKIALSPADVTRTLMSIVFPRLNDGADISLNLASTL